jgi:hypothetical protein
LAKFSFLYLTRYISFFMKTLLPPFTLLSRSSHLVALAACLLIGFFVGNFPDLCASEAGWKDKEIAEWPSQVAPDAFRVEGGTEIRWLPQPFVFQQGDSVRYIDFEKGNDGNSGLTKDEPWKHHPWDPRATEKSAAEKGSHTYVFKGGVIYRGNLVAEESGTEAEPDPANPRSIMGNRSRDVGWFYGCAGLEEGGCC